MRAAVDHHQSAGHSTAVSRESAAQKIAAVACDLNHSARCFRGRENAAVPRDLNSAGVHRHSQVIPSISLYRDLAIRHSGAEIIERVCTVSEDELRTNAARKGEQFARAQP
jgi:hypothetical protein